MQNQMETFRFMIVTIVIVNPEFILLHRFQLLSKADNNSPTITQSVSKNISKSNFFATFLVSIIFHSH